jgi:hypothetical protein
MAIGMEPGAELANMLALAGTQAKAGLTEMPVWLDSPGQLGPQVPRALLDLFERVRPHSQTRPWVPAPTPQWLPRLKAYASRRSLLHKRWGLPGGILTRFVWREKKAGYYRSEPPLSPDVENAERSSKSSAER